MNYLSLFSGIGGFELAIQQVISATCLGYCEIDDHPASVYANRFFGHIRTKDVRNISGRTLYGQQLDLLVAGFPCTDLSVANQYKEGLNGESSGLFWTLNKLIKDLKPKYFIVENVSSMHAFERDIVSAELGYAPLLTEASNISHARRARLFWTNFPVRPVIPTNIGKFEQVLENNVSAGLNLSKAEIGYMDSIVGGWKRWEKGFHNDTDHTKTHCITANMHKGVPNNVLIDRRSGNPVIRKMSPLECERLMGFPDNWTMFGVKGLVPDSRRFKMIGNSVSIPVVKYVVQSLVDHMRLKGEL